MNTLREKIDKSIWNYVFGSVWNVLLKNEFIPSATLGGSDMFSISGTIHNKLKTYDFKRKN